MREFEIKPELERKLVKFSRKNRVLYSQILKKIDEIRVSDESHYKNLRYDLNEYKRVHIGHFVLLFGYVGDMVVFYDIEHHDKVYL
jgi:mRNA-degrading endonuclease RelE of RelBE toxin-antitoxin system